jgi:hypothetical protein
MKRKKSAPVPPPSGAVRAGAALALALAAAWLTSLPGIPDRPTRVWRGYDTLLVRAEPGPSGARAHLQSALGPGVVSELTARVSFWDFTGIGSVPVAGIEARLDARDPRRDRVMDELPGYFRTPASPDARSRPETPRHTLLYFPARRSALVDFLRISAVLGFPRDGSWRLVEFDPIEFVLSAAALVSLALLLSAPFRTGSRERLLLAGAGVMLWIPFLIPGGVARLALALCLFFAWFPAVEMCILLRGWDQKLLKEVREPLVKLLAAAGAGLVILLPASGFSASALLSCAGPVTGSVLLIVARALLWGRARRPRKRRTKFEPVRIVKPPAGARRAGPSALVLSVAAVVLVAVIALLKSEPLPTPLPVAGARDYSWESLARLTRESRARRLPDISDLVTHAAFQESVSFGRPWGLPRPDERVYVRDFGQDPVSGSLAAEKRTVKAFDSAWLSSALRGPAEGSVEGLLFAQGRAMAVAFRGQVRTLLREIPVALIMIYILWSWFAREPGAAPLMKGVLLRFTTGTRRNQVP